jgi:23S rRNA pseudouridine2605 synthase
VKHTKSSRKIGLARALSKLGYCSRSAASELIRAGHVRLNGATPHNPETPVRMEKDRIEVDHGDIVQASKVYLVLNKPRGVITTTADAEGRKTVYSFLDNDSPWVAPVGRLDKASEGLLLLTNDTEWSAAVLAPEMHLEKTYHVQIRGVADAALCKSLVAGVRLHDGTLLHAKNASVLRGGKHNTWLEIILDEGKNRQIRRMLELKSVVILRLVRVAIGPLVLGDLPKGCVRTLTVKERRALDRAMRRNG